MVVFLFCHDYEVQQGHCFYSLILLIHYYALTSLFKPKITFKFIYCSLISSISHPRTRKIGLSINVVQFIRWTEQQPIKCASVLNQAIVFRSQLSNTTWKSILRMKCCHEKLYQPHTHKNKLKSLLNKRVGSLTS